MENGRNNGYHAVSMAYFREPFIGVKIGLAEVLTKMILYYLHERVWYLSDFGLPERSLRYQDKNVKKSE